MDFQGLQFDWKVIFINKWINTLTRKGKTWQRIYQIKF